MFPRGFLGTRADLLIDIVTLSFVVVLPLMLWSWHLVRTEKRHRLHRNVQLSLAITLAIVVGIFEYDLKQSGGIFELVKGSSWEGTALLNGIIYVHTMLAVLASLTWSILVVISLLRFSNPPGPNAFSSTHRFWGRIGMLAMTGAALTALPLYYFGFAS